MSRFYLVTIVAMGLFTSPYVWAGMNKHETSIATYGYKIPIIVNTTQQSDNDLKSDIDQNKIPMVQDTGVVKPLQVPQDKVVAPASMSVPAPVIVPVPEKVLDKKSEKTVEPPVSQPQPALPPVAPKDEMAQ
jgi:hypothetical protein